MSIGRRSFPLLAAVAVAVAGGALVTPRLAAASKARVTLIRWPYT